MKRNAKKISKAKPSSNPKPVNVAVEPPVKSPDKNFLENYLKLNDGFDNPIVYLPRRGNFSDFNLMVNSCAYALIKKRKIYLSDAYLHRFAGSRWGDYFETTLPFAEEHKVRVPREATWPKGGDAIQLMRALLVPMIASDDEVDIPGLDFKGTTTQLLRAIATNILSTNDVVDGHVKTVMADHGLVPGKYAAMHIRKGDKWRGTPEQEGAYLSAGRSLADRFGKIFIMTDDVRSIEAIKENVEDADLVYLATDEHLGFNSNIHAEKEHDDKQSDLLQLLIEVEIAKKAGAFVGWYQSNVSNNIALTTDYPEEPYDVFKPKVRWYTCT